MLKDMKTSIKLACGFGAVTAILAALGVIAFVMFSRVDGNMTELGAHSLPAVKHAASPVCGAGRHYRGKELRHIQEGRIPGHGQSEDERAGRRPRRGRQGG